MLRLLVLLALITRVIAEADCDVGDSSDLSLFRGFIEANDFSCAIQFVTEAKAESIATVRSEFDMLQRKLTSKLNDLKAAIESAAPAKKIKEQATGAHAFRTASPARQVPRTTCR